MNNIKLFISGFKSGLRNFGENISLIINSLLLLLVYIIAVGLTALVARLTGKHFLELKLDKNKKSYWTDLNLKKKSINKYYRQF